MAKTKELRYLMELTICPLDEPDNVVMFRAAGVTVEETEDRTQLMAYACGWRHDNCHAYGQALMKWRDTVGLSSKKQLW